MLNTHQQRRGVSLLELLVVVSIIGIFASLATARFGRTILGDFGSQSEARRLSLDLLQAQRMAITTGDNHLLEFDGNGTMISGYRILRRTSTGTEPVGNARTFSTDVQVRSSHARAEFTFEGQALEPYQLNLQGKNRHWRVEVVPISGAIRVAEL